MIARLLIALSLALSSSAWATDRTVANPSDTAIMDAINGTGAFAGNTTPCSPSGALCDGDRVFVPAGPATWTKGIDITKAIEVIGATTTNVDNTSASPAPVYGAAVFTDSTIITPNGITGNGLVRITLSDPNPVTDNPNPPRTGIFRLSGFTFHGGPAPGVTEGCVQVSGVGKRFRVDHNHFENAPGACDIEANGFVFGVADHNVQSSTTLSHQSYRFYENTWAYPDAKGVGGAGALAKNGDGSWADDEHYGMERFFFVEDNYIRNGTRDLPPCTPTLTTNCQKGGIEYSDATQGGRGVIRHNRNLDTQYTQHSTFGNRWRGARAFDIYENIFDNVINNPDLAAISSGTGTFHDNKIVGLLPTQAGVLISNQRTVSGTVQWRGPSGANPWDKNDPTLYDTGTVAASPAPTNTSVTLTGKTYTTDQWQHYRLYKRSNGRMAAITGNSTTGAFTLAFYSDDKDLHNFAAGDTLEIRKVITQLDDPGRGKGDIINDASQTITDAVLVSGNATLTSNSAFFNPNETGSRFTVTGSSGIQPGTFINTYLSPTSVLLNKTATQSITATVTIFRQAVNMAPSTGGPSGPKPFWPNNKLVPIYSWNNLKGSTQVDAAVKSVDSDLHTVCTGPTPGPTCDVINRMAMPGYTTYTYHHPLTGSASAPRFTNVSSTAFSELHFGSFPFTTTGFTGTVSYNVTSGSLPSGVSLVSSTGVMSGTPASGTNANSPYQFTVTATDGIAAPQDQVFSLTVNPSPPPPAINPPTSDTFTELVAGHQWTFQVANFSGTPTFSESGALPSGLSLSGGVLSGTPAASTAGNYPITVTAQYPAVSPTETANQSFTLIVNPNAPTPTPPPAIIVTKP